MRHLSNGFKSKYIADTAKISDLKKQLEDLEFKKPTTIIKVVTKEVEIEKKVDQIEQNQDTISIIDFYPDRENPFIKYSNKFSLSTKKGNSKFKIYPFKITGVINQEENGLYSFNLDVPDFIEIDDIQVQSLPIKSIKKDNFGYIFGFGYGTNLNDKFNFININSYLRFNKFYIGLEGNTQGNVSGGIKFEF